MPYVLLLPPMLLMHHTSQMSVNQAAHRSPCCLLFNSIDQTHVCTEACIMPGLTPHTTAFGGFFWV